MEFKEILILLFDNDKEKLHINKIVGMIDDKNKEKNRTGLKHKQNVTRSIEKLKKAGLVKKEKHGKQKILVTLTPIGHELSEFITAIDNYNISYFNFINALNEKVLFIFARDLTHIEKDRDELEHSDLDEEFKEEVRDMKLILIKKGWSREEIKLYNKIRTILIDFKVICDNNFINILLSRYSRIIKIHDKEKPLLLNFLQYLIKESIGKKIDYMLENYESEIFGYSSIRIINPNESKQPTIIVHQNTGDIYQYFAYLYNIFYTQIITPTVEKEVEYMISSYLELLQLPMEIDWFEVDNLNKLIKNYEFLLNNQQEQKFSDIQKTKIILKRKTANILLKSISKYNAKYKDKSKRFLWTDVPFIHR